MFLKLEIGDVLYSLAYRQEQGVYAIEDFGCIEVEINAFDPNIPWSLIDDEGKSHQLGKLQESQTPKKEILILGDGSDEPEIPAGTLTPFLTVQLENGATVTFLEEWPDCMACVKIS